MNWCVENVSYFLSCSEDDKSRVWVTDVGCRLKGVHEKTVIESDSLFSFSETSCYMLLSHGILEVPELVVGMSLVDLMCSLKKLYY